MTFERNERKRTYRQAECCKESQSKECLHCRCCQKMKNWRQLHVGLIYTETYVTAINKFYLENNKLQIKNNVDPSRVGFEISEMTKGFVLRNI